MTLAKHKTPRRNLAETKALLVQAHRNGDWNAASTLSQEKEILMKSVRKKNRITRCRCGMAKGFNSEMCCTCRCQANGNKRRKKHLAFAALFIAFALFTFISPAQNIMPPTTVPTVIVPTNKAVRMPPPSRNWQQQVCSAAGALLNQLTTDTNDYAVSTNGCVTALHSGRMSLTQYGSIGLLTVDCVQGENYSLSNSPDLINWNLYAHWHTRGAIAPFVLLSNTANYFKVSQNPRPMTQSEIIQAAEYGSQWAISVMQSNHWAWPNN